MVDRTAEEMKQAAKDRAAREAGVRAELNAEAERVMNESRPTPTQAENDAVKRGEMRPEDTEDPDNPAMCSLGEQQARIAEASNDRAAYSTRQMRPARVSDGDRITSTTESRRRFEPPVQPRKADQV